MTSLLPSDVLRFLALSGLYFVSDNKLTSHQQILSSAEFGSHYNVKTFHPKLVQVVEL